MNIYTRSGDTGFTFMPGSKRVRKDDPPVKAVGELDELNCSIGLALCQARRVAHAVISSILPPIQQELLTLGSRLASPGTGKSAREMPPGAIERMERDIDALCGELGPLHSLILPGGCELACRLHVCRAICRRAERAAVDVLVSTQDQPPRDPVAIAYLNRLSDMLFMLARLANHDTGESETTWPGRTSV